MQMHPTGAEYGGTVYYTRDAHMAAAAAARDLKTMHVLQIQEAEAHAYIQAAYHQWQADLKEWAAWQENHAATVIQAAFRGHKVRRAVAAERVATAAAETVLVMPPEPVVELDTEPVFGAAHEPDEPVLEAMARARGVDPAGLPGPGSGQSARPAGHVLAKLGATRNNAMFLTWDAGNGNVKVALVPKDTTVRLMANKRSKRATTWLDSDDQVVDIPEGVWMTTVRANTTRSGLDTVPIPGDHKAALREQLGFDHDGRLRWCPWCFIGEACGLGCQGNGHTDAPALKVPFMVPWVEE